MINLTKKIITFHQIQRSVNLLEQIKFYQSFQQKNKPTIKQLYLHKYSLICCNKNKQLFSQWNKNKAFFSTLSNNRLKKISHPEKPLSSEQNIKFQQYEKDNKIILQDLQNFISDLQKIHQTDSENYEKISSTIDKYINQKIFAFYSQKATDSQSVVYFFQNQNLLQNYSTALNIKSSVQFRFRKYDEILTNIQNEIYLLKFLKVEEKVRKNMQKLCNMYIFTLIFNDHQKLRSILRKDYNKMQNIEQDTQKEQTRSGGRRISRKFYERPVQKSEQNLDENQTKNKKNSQSSLFKAFKLYMRSESPSCLLSRAIAYSVIGQVQKSLEIFCQLLNFNRKNKLFLGNFLSVYIFFGNQNYVLSQGKGYSSENLKDFVKNFLIKQNNQLTVKSLPDKISPEDAEYLVNSVLGFIKDQPLQWTDLSNTEIKQFTHPIYLIAQNYYLSGQKQKATKIIEELNKKIQNKEIKLTGQIERKGRKLSQKSKSQNSLKTSPTQLSSQLSNIQMLIQFFQLMRFYDTKQYSKIKEMQTTFQAQQKKKFYEFQSIPNDILRSNIYQIFSQTYRDLKDNQKADQYSQLSLGNDCVNNSYEVNQLQDIEDHIGLKKTQEKEISTNKNRGIPPHYLNLLQQLKDFQVKFI